MRPVPKEAIMSTFETLVVIGIVYIAMFVAHRATV
jgi:hypothetical protein